MSEKALLTIEVEASLPFLATGETGADLTGVRCFMVDSDDAVARIGFGKGFNSEEPNDRWTKVARRSFRCLLVAKVARSDIG